MLFLFCCREVDLVVDVVSLLSKPPAHVLCIIK